MRSYITKRDLAVQFLPNIDPRSATNRLMIWIKRDPQLMQHLRSLGYRTNQKYFTPEQRVAIEEALCL